MISKSYTALDSCSILQKVAVLAGYGWLPRLVYDSCLERGIDCHIIALAESFSHELFEGIPYHILRVHMLSKIITKLKSLNVQHVVLAGTVKRPNLTKLLLDIKGAKLLAMIARAGINDNAIFASIIAFLEAEGLTIVPADAIAASALMQEGCLTEAQPDARVMADIKKGTEILKAIAHFDVGQALVIQSGLVLGVEAVEGTDELIKRCGTAQQRLEKKCVLIKICKPNQDKRVDLPCIGLETIKNLQQYNFQGIALQAKQAFILNKDAVIAEADRAGLFIYGI